MHLATGFCVQAHAGAPAGAPCLSALDTPGKSCNHLQGYPTHSQQVMHNRQLSAAARELDGT